MAAPLSPLCCRGAQVACRTPFVSQLTWPGSTVICNANPTLASLWRSAGDHAGMGARWHHLLISSHFSLRSGCTRYCVWACSARSLQVTLQCKVSAPCFALMHDVSWHHTCLPYYGCRACRCHRRGNHKQRGQPWGPHRAHTCW